jgi:DNA-binding response OmpR family regulator
LEVLKSIRKHQPDLPVIILTALVDKKDECFKLGADAFIKKPYSLEELERALEGVVERETFEAVEFKPPQGLIPCAKILIVDDEIEVCELLADSLKEAPGVRFEVKWVLNGEEALRQSVNFEPDIAIIDIKMPFMWGDELLNDLKRGKVILPKTLSFIPVQRILSMSQGLKKQATSLLPNPWISM